MKGDDPKTWELLRKIIFALRGRAAERRWAATELYKMYGGRLRCYMARYAPPAEAEELMHDVFVRVMTCIDQFQQGAEQFPAWLWTIARRVRLDWLARQDPPREDEEALRQAPANDSSDPLICQLDDAIRGCVARNYERYRRTCPQHAFALSLLVTDQLEIQDIAKVLNRSYGATRQYLTECRKKLRTFLEPCRGLLSA